MFSYEDLKYNFESGKKIKFLFFWGHQPTKDGSISSSCLSQWWISPFEIDGINYPSTEHYMMAEKARLFNDEVVLNKILNSNSDRLKWFFF